MASLKVEITFTGLLGATRNKTWKLLVVDYSPESVSLVSAPALVQLTLALSVGEFKYSVLYLRRYSITVRNLCAEIILCYSS